jgi:hypothetical protein
MHVPITIRESSKQFIASRWKCDGGYPSTNVMVLARHDLTFVNGWVGYEGSLSNEHILNCTNLDHYYPGSLTLPCAPASS